MHHPLECTVCGLCGPNAAMWHVGPQTEALLILICPAKRDGCLMSHWKEGALHCKVYLSLAKKSEYCVYDVSGLHKKSYSIKES